MSIKGYEKIIVAPASTFGLQKQFLKPFISIKGDEKFIVSENCKIGLQP